MKTSGKRNRSAGQGFERELVKIFKQIGFPHVVTTRSESKARDDQKVDLMNKDEYKNGRFPYNIQAKNVRGHLPYGKILSEMPTLKEAMNVVVHKQTERVNNRFVTRDRFAIMKLEDFLTLVQQRDDRRFVREQLVPVTTRGDTKRVLRKSHRKAAAGVPATQSVSETSRNL